MYILYIQNNICIYMHIYILVGVLDHIYIYIVYTRYIYVK